MTANPDQWLSCFLHSLEVNWLPWRSPGPEACQYRHVKVSVWKVCSLLIRPSPWEAVPADVAGGGTLEMVSSPQSWACWPSLWPFPWVGSRRCSERRRTRWAPRTQTRSRSRSRRLAPWWLTLEGGRSGRSPSAWSWSAQSWSLSREDAKTKSEVLRGTRGITHCQPPVNSFTNLSLTLWNN